MGLPFRGCREGEYTKILASHSSRIPSSPELEKRRIPLSRTVKELRAVGKALESLRREREPPSPEERIERIHSLIFANGTHKVNDLGPRAVERDSQESHKCIPKRPKILIAGAQ